MPSDRASDHVFVGLGSNQGGRLGHLQAAADGFAAQEGVAVLAASPVYETEAHTLRRGEQQPAFLNAALRLRTSLSPERLLDVGQRLEADAGRAPERRRARWAPRPLDVDLLVVGGETRDTPRLALPHPRLAERRFVLQPLADLCPNLRVPTPFEATVSELLRRCSDRAALRRTRHALRLS